jgi:ABC-2 type transport system ATP-binding protein
MREQTATSPTELVVSVTGLCRRFGVREALSGVSLELPAGCVYGLVGENGAGKTTLIRHLLGLLRAQAGGVRVFGTDPVRHPAEVLARIGYLSEDRDLPEWMRVGELMRYTAAFHPTWDPAFAEELRQRFGLDPAARVRELSRGQKAMAGLLCALAHRPQLLLLDEPSSGLDAVVRRQILAAIIRTVADEGRTVLFSSHLLDEVERVADRVAMIHSGRVVLEGPLEDIRREHSVVTIVFERRTDALPTLPGVLQIDKSEAEWTALCNGGRAALDAALAKCGGRIVAERSPSLEDIFVARVGAPAAAPEEE